MDAPEPTSSSSAPPPKNLDIFFGGIFHSEIVQQLVFILRSMVMSNINLMRAEVQKFQVKNKQVSLLRGFQTCLRRVPNWSEGIRLTEERTWVGVYPQLPKIFQRSFHKCVRAYAKKDNRIKQQGMKTPSLADFLFEIMNNFCASSDVVSMRVFVQSDSAVDAIVARAVRQTCLDNITKLYFSKK